MEKKKLTNIKPTLASRDPLLNDETPSIQKKNNYPTVKVDIYVDGRCVATRRFTSNNLQTLIMAKQFNSHSAPVESATHAELLWDNMILVTGRQVIHAIARALRNASPRQQRANRARILKNKRAEKKREAEREYMRG